MLVRRPAKTIASGASEAVPDRGVSVELDTNDVLVGVEMRVTGTFIIGTADCTAILDGGLLSLISNISLIGDGDDKFITNVAFREAAELTKILRAVETNNSTTLAVTAATYTVDMTAAFDFRLENPRGIGMRHPMRFSTDIPAAKYKNLIFGWDWEALSAAGTPDTTTALTETMSAQVVGIYDVNSDPNLPRHMRRYIGKNTPLNGSGQVDEIECDGDYLIRSLYFRVRDTSAADNDIVGNVEFKVGFPGREYSPYDEDFEAIRDENRRLFGQIPNTGNALLFFDKDGSGNQMIPPKQSQADFMPTATTTPSATADIKGILEVIELNPALAPAPDAA